MILAMSDEVNFKQNNAWRSKFRSRNHDMAHEQAPEVAHDLQGREDIFRGKPVLIDKQEDLVALVARLRAEGLFAYDSEFVGELSYVPKLCLIQIGTEHEIALVDPLAGLDLMPIWEILADESVEKIVHAGSQDMEPVLRLLGRPAANIFDTQIAAGFARLPYPISLQRIVLQLLNIKLGKGLTFTQWDQRPLSFQQTRYAADDVRFLPAVWRELHKIIEAAGTMAWVKEECAATCGSTPYTFDRETTYLRVRGSGTLDPRQLGMLRELAVWRDAEARHSDVPPRTYLRDEIMIELCRRAPKTEDALLNIQGLPRPIRVSHSPAILDAIQRGAQTPATKSAELRKTDELPRQQFQTDAIFAVAQAVCLARGVDPQLVFTRGDLGEMLSAIRNRTGLDEVKLMQGWRRELVGEVVAKLCTKGGEIGVAVNAMELSTTRLPE